MTGPHINPNDYVSDITVNIGLALREHLRSRHPGKIRGRVRDSSLATVPGRTIFVPATATSTAHQAAAKILPLVLRDIQQQLDDASISPASDRWSVALTWDGHGLFDDGQFVQDGFRFDAYLEVFAETP